MTYVELHMTDPLGVVLIPSRTSACRYDWPPCELRGVCQSRQGR